jgi:hypothetical protein
MKTIRRVKVKDLN